MKGEGKQYRKTGLTNLKKATIEIERQKELCWAWLKGYAPTCSHRTTTHVQIKKLMIQLNLKWRIKFKKWDNCTSRAFLFQPLAPHTHLIWQSANARAFAPDRKFLASLRPPTSSTPNMGLQAFAAQQSFKHSNDSIYTSNPTTQAKQQRNALPFLTP